MGQVLGGVLGKKNGKGKKKLMNGLTSGAGLMTAIGLAVGAYEILKDKKTGGAMAMPGMPGPPPPPFPGPGQTASDPVSSPPPVPPPQWTTAPPVAPVSASPAPRLGSEEIARRMIQVMVAAAHADGTMDEREERAILDKLRAIDLSQEERMFLLDELHHPRDVASLVAGMSDSSTAKVMYMLAFSTVEVDAEVERAWLNELATGLGLSPAVQAFIEEQNR
ncbi:DUF533 domain-containing protein [Desulfoprunum benzoelyticum]|uniref:DUF533 domain-containing protein n=1 Tax=Desulfoprunum benzoelyticum TaxID=1506996 RepID=UPI001F0538FB|nr:DUF533 domain-containing protein [Desulfoprunum benzoelyticum]